MNPNYCERCRQFFTLDNLRKISGEPFRHGQAQTVVDSARNGCPFCGLMCHVKVCEVFGLPDDSELLEFQPEDWVLVHIRAGDGESLIDFVDIEVEGDDQRGSCRAFAADEDPCSIVTSFRPVEVDVNSPAVVTAARRLISTCERAHPACRAKFDSKPPSRVLRVDSAEPRIYLCSDGDFISEGYVALSYCWGGDQPIKLLSSNKVEFERGILSDALPKTLQDAVACTRELGYSYLWVDALCIVQDSDEDKLQEIGNMASIYRNAAVTITAAVAQSVFEGYLGYDRPNSVQSSFKAWQSKVEYCHVNIEMEDGQLGTLTIIPKVNGRAITKVLPLNKRAWCLQESILPRRLLYYGPQELLFRCRTIDCQPVMPSVIDYTDGVDPPRILSHRPRNTEAKALWYNLVQDFSRRGVSVAEDRMHALAGIIYELEREWKDECGFGIWKSRLLEDLCWVSVNDPWTQDPIRWSHAPSWSWMSLDNGIEVNERDFELIDAEFHEISGTAIHLTCRVMTKADQPEGRRISYHPDFKVTSDETDGLPVDYLYIGPARWKDRASKGERYANFAIAAVELDKNIYRRVGIVERNINKKSGIAIDVWMRPSRRRIKLI
ncbi:hypothetical protein M426DRAFT_17692 [Hypoxylon sp. CI-4A]|nr:hypothetical protein M426DRAFT_17692 [Hypoxylon sp. CI-4A]